MTSKAKILATIVSNGQVLADGNVSLVQLGLNNIENKSSEVIRSEITSSNVTTALGFTPYNATNPSGFITSTALSPYLTTSSASSTYQTALVSGSSIKTVNGQSVLGSGNIQIDGGVTSFNTRTGAVTLSSGDVTGALGFTPYNSTNPSGYITSSALTSYLPLSGGTLTGALTGTSFSDGYITWTSAQLNRAGSNIELQWAGTAGSTVFIGANGPKPIRFYADTGNALFSGTLNALGAITQNGNQVLHAGNVSSYALPIGGGNVSYLGINNASAINLRGAGTGTYNTSWIYSDTTVNSWEAPKTTDSGAGAKVPFILTWRGGYSSEGGLRLTGGSAGELGGNTILHAGNYSSYALPLSGGTLSGGVSITGQGSASNTPSVASANIGTYVGTYAFIDLATQDGNGSWIDFSKGNGGDYAGRIRYNNTNERFDFSNAGGGTSLSFTSSSLTFGGNTVLHAGNYSSYALPLNGNANAVKSSGYGDGNFTWRQDSGSFAGQTGWASYLISNHGNGATYYNQTLIMPFWGAPQYSRLEGGTFKGPYTFLTSENAKTINGTSLVGSGNITVGGGGPGLSLMPATRYTDVSQTFTYVSTVSKPATSIWITNYSYSSVSVNYRDILAAAASEMAANGMTYISGTFKVRVENYAESGCTVYFKPNVSYVSGTVSPDSPYQYFANRTSSYGVDGGDPAGYYAVAYYTVPSGETRWFEIGYTIWPAAWGLGYQLFFPNPTNLAA